MKALLLLLFVSMTSMASAQVYPGVYYNLREARENINICTVLLQAGGNKKKAAPSICRLVNLEMLDFQKNELDSIPSCIGTMGSLKNLYLSSNKMKKFPESVCGSTSLELLALDNNQIVSVPNEIGNVSTLKILYIGHDKLTSLPEEIGSLSNLKVLEMNGNDITTLPSSMKKLSKLEYLILDGTKISNLNEILPSLKNLKLLSIGGTYGTSPEEMAALKAALPKGCILNPVKEQIEAAGHVSGYVFPKIRD